MLALLAVLSFLAAAPPSDVIREGTEMRRARDGDIAIKEELEAARRAATVEAYDLFIARHPDHALARIAREERQCLLDRQKSPRP